VTPRRSVTGVTQYDGHAQDNPLELAVLPPHAGQGGHRFKAYLHNPIDGRCRTTDM
jgi:hypothetical protein